MATATAGFATLGAGLLALAEPTPLVPTISAFVTLLCIVGFMFAVGMSTERHGTQALVMVLALPVVAGLYAAALPYVGRGGPALGIFLVGLGVAAFGRAVGLRPSEVTSSGARAPT